MPKINVVIIALTTEMYDLRYIFRTKSIQQLLYDDILHYPWNHCTHFMKPHIIIIYLYTWLLSLF